MARRTKTPNQIQWDKEIKRIKQQIRRGEARGYDFSKLKSSGILDRPQRITRKRLEILRGIRGTATYKYATYTDPATGATVSGTEGRRRERSRAAQQGRNRRKPGGGGVEYGNDSTASREAYVAEIIGNFYAEIQSLPPRLTFRVISWIETKRNEYGDWAIANAIMQIPESLLELLQKCGYDSDQFMLILNQQIMEGVKKFLSVSEAELEGVRYNPDDEKKHEKNIDVWEYDDDYYPEYLAEDRKQ